MRVRKRRSSGKHQQLTSSSLATSSLKITTSNLATSGLKMSSSSLASTSLSSPISIMAASPAGPLHSSGNIKKIVCLMPAYAYNELHLLLDIKPQAFSPSFRLVSIEPCTLAIQIFSNINIPLRLKLHMIFTFLEE